MDADRKRDSTKTLMEGKRKRWEMGGNDVNLGASGVRDGIGNIEKKKRHNL